jgi:hypothetical protein
MLSLYSKNPKILSTKLGYKDQRTALALKASTYYHFPSYNCTRVGTDISV